MDDRTLAERVGKLEESQKAVHDALLGTPELQMDGTVVRLEDGLVSQMGQIQKQLSNGGVKVKIPKSVWAAILAAIISGVFQILTTVL
jgi:hypothetical protein